MRARIEPGGTVGGETLVPGDKSIAHRWLVLAATARGESSLHNLPPALDVRSTARCLAALTIEARDVLEAWASNPPDLDDAHGFTFNKGEPRSTSPRLDLSSAGRAVLQVPGGPLDCGNSGTTIRLLAGVLATCPFTSTLTGDESLRRRPMERVAEPLRMMGATVRTDEGRPPVEITGGRLHGIRFEGAVPSAQVKSAVLLAGLAAEGPTAVSEPAPTRDHTERALRHLGAPIRVGEDGAIIVEAFQHGGFDASVPGDVSSAAFLAVAAALTGARLTVLGVGLNPSRIGFVHVMARMGVRLEGVVTRDELGEPVGELRVEATGDLRGTTVEADELPLVIDEVPALALLAANADGETLFRGAGELRVKESDRLSGLASLVRSLGGHAQVQGDDLLIGGGGMEGGRGEAHGDHRMAMALTVAGVATRSPVEVEGVEAADVSFPGFIRTLRALGARIDG